MTALGWALAAVAFVAIGAAVMYQRAYQDARTKWGAEACARMDAEQQVKRLRADLFRERNAKGRSSMPSRVAATLELRRDLAAWDRGERPAGWTS